MYSQVFVRFLSDRLQRYSAITSKEQMYWKIWQSQITNMSNEN